MSELQAIGLALRDLVELTGAERGTLKLKDGTLTMSERGLWLSVPGDAPVDLSEWVDYVGLLPAEVSA